MNRLFPRVGFLIKKNNYSTFLYKKTNLQFIKNQIDFYNLRVLIQNGFLKNSPNSFDSFCSGYVRWLRSLSHNRIIVAKNEEEHNEGEFDESSTSEHQPEVFVRGAGNLKPVLDFKELELHQPLFEILNRLNYHEPTPIQAHSLPLLLPGMDLIGIAQTGSGKTLAYLLPAFNKFYSIHRNYFGENQNGRLNPKVLILAPTRELAVQISEVIRQFRIFKSICLYGGSDRKKQIEFLERNNVLFLISTPGRLKDLVDAQFVDLKEVSYLVVDEADRMLDMGFEPQISYLIQKCCKQRQTMMFSATWPEEVKGLVGKYLKNDHAFLSIGGTKLVANHNIEQKIIVCENHLRLDYLNEIFVQKHPGERCLLFCNTKQSCNYISSLLYRKYKVRSSPFHGDMTQKQRETALRDFKNSDLQVLCATNVAARGLDIDSINVVVNHDFPTDIETYVHRIGRTGRKKNKGVAYSFFTDFSNSFLAKKLIEVLEESENEVPQDLKNLTYQQSYKKNSARQNNKSYGMINKPKYRENYKY